MYIYIHLYICIYILYNQLKSQGNVIQGIANQWVFLVVKAPCFVTTTNDQVDHNYFGAYQDQCFIQQEEVDQNPSKSDFSCLSSVMQGLHLPSLRLAISWLTVISDILGVVCSTKYPGYCTLGSLIGKICLARYRYGFLGS